MWNIYNNNTMSNNTNMEENIQSEDAPVLGGMDGAWGAPDVLDNYISSPSLNTEGIEKAENALAKGQMNNGYGRFTHLDPLNSLRNTNMGGNDKSENAPIMGRFNGGQGDIPLLNSAWTNPDVDLSFRNDAPSGEHSFNQAEVNEGFAHTDNHSDNNSLLTQFNGYPHAASSDQQGKTNLHKFLGHAANSQAGPFQNRQYGGPNAGAASGGYHDHGFQQVHFGNAASTGNNYKHQAEYFLNQQNGTPRMCEGGDRAGSVRYGYSSNYFRDMMNSMPSHINGNFGYGSLPNIKLEPGNNMMGFQGQPRSDVNTGHSRGMAGPSLGNRHEIHSLHRELSGDEAYKVEPISGGGSRDYEEELGIVQNSRRDILQDSFKEIEGGIEKGNAGHEENRGASQDTISFDDNYYRGNAGFEPIDVYPGLILDERQYQQEVDKRIRKERGESMTSQDVVDDSPKDPREQREYIARLYSAIKCCDQDVISDKPCKNNRPAQAAQRLLGTYYPDIEIEKACWATFIACRDASLGIRMVDLHHATKHQGREAYPTFRERFNAIIKSCKISKAACKQLLDPLYLHRLVDAPGAELQMKENNKRINAERDIQNQFGRQALKHGLDKEILEREEQLKQEFLENGIGEFEVPLNTPASSRFSTPIKAAPINRAIKARGPRTPATRRTASSTKRSLGTTSTGKRKAPTNWDASDSDGDGTYHLDDEERSTGAKRQFSGQSRFRTELNGSPTPSTGRRQPTRTSASKARLVNQAMATELASPVPMLELDMKYRIIICKLLGVSEELATHESLKQLRVYARAYNGRLANDPWIHSELPEGAYGMGPKIVMKTGLVDHFSQFIDGFHNIANARGDITGPGVVVRDSPRYFDTHGELEKDQALGLAENPFALIWGDTPQY